MRSKYLVTLFIVFSTILAGGLLPECRRTTADKIIPLTKSWEMPIPHQEIPAGLTSLSAAECGVCHPQHYLEWKQSTHAIAWQDLQFQAELRKDNIVFCINCHTPLQNQQEFIIKGTIHGDYSRPVKEPNPHFDKKLQLESITCASCHVRNGKVIGTKGGTAAPHATIRDVEFLSEKVCLNCHNVVDVLNPSLVCTFETGDEWEANWAKQAGKNCISCHMPTVERSIYAGLPAWTSHQHHFPASGIPKFFGLLPARLQSLEIKEISIDTSYRLGDSLHYALSLKNSFAGHAVPTGDPERFINVQLTLLDSNHKIAHQEKYRIGEEWHWHPEATKISDNNLQPLETRNYHLEYVFKTAGRYRLSVEISKHRMNEENARHNGILGHYPLSISIFRQEYEFIAK